ncbi:DUF339 family protein [Capsaspora owczarzaki ATCC 30864]|uniref:Succinate dehydrogenase assembly factor 2, mitochondrial n=1 Tax=Capsaspora owczarzaki (strain ATCC 30864) TaxID=595528 RepID=A0A0D2VMV7_CAPO3|nr:DUF339 family protein [Capsaspora owczarzaki ATCC 30864]KJE91532.1 DUF339 family protein [Capsaspora owczarzaki ATCC 30864]|eukprot:XP_004349410.1 DUF339 family protein [Capsaspora owczarzaki ATCC 30864]
MNSAVLSHQVALARALRSAVLASPARTALLATCAAESSHAATGSSNTGAGRQSPASPPSTSGLANMQRKDLYMPSSSLEGDHFSVDVRPAAKGPGQPIDADLSQLPPIPPVVRGPETRQVKIARLLYQTRKRGILENDLLLSTFFAEHANALSDAQLQTFDKLLDQIDWDIYYWITKARPVPPEFDTDVMALIQAHTLARRNGPLRQPSTPQVKSQ